MHSQASSRWSSIAKILSELRWLDWAEQCSADGDLHENIENKETVIFSSCCSFKIALGIDTRTYKSIFRDLVTLHSRPWTPSVTVELDMDQVVQKLREELGISFEPISEDRGDQNADGEEARTQPSQAKHAQPGL